MTPLIEARGLTKRYKQVSMRSTASTSSRSTADVIALLGPNGAGKTTFVRSVATLLRPDARHPARRRHRRRRQRPNESAGSSGSPASTPRSSRR